MQPSRRPGKTTSVGVLATGILALVVAPLIFNPRSLYAIESASAICVSKDNSADTLIGPVRLDKKSVQSLVTQADGIHDNAYTDKLLGFTISWPATGKWVPELPGKEALDLPNISLPLAVTYAETKQVNVTIVIEFIGPVSLPFYTKKSMAAAPDFGLTYTDCAINNDARVAVVSGKLTQAHNYVVQRIFKLGDNAIQITATLPEQYSTKRTIRDDLLAILNSFEVIGK
jgi:hypothetical protein